VSQGLSEVFADLLQGKFFQLFYNFSYASGDLFYGRRNSWHFRIFPAVYDLTGRFIRIDVQINVKLSGQEIALLELRPETLFHKNLFPTLSVNGLLAGHFDPLRFYLNCDWDSKIHRVIVKLQF